MEELSTAGGHSDHGHRDGRSNEEWHQALRPPVAAIEPSLNLFSLLIGERHRTLVIPESAGLEPDNSAVSGRSAD